MLSPAATIIERMIESSEAVWSSAVGAELARALPDVDVAGLDRGGVLAYLRACQRFLAFGEAMMTGALARFAADGDAADQEFAAAEVAAELALSPRTAERRLSEAHDLASRLPTTVAGMRAGVVDGWRARTSPRRPAH